MMILVDGRFNDIDIPSKLVTLLHPSPLSLSSFPFNSPLLSFSMICYDNHLRSVLYVTNEYDME